MFNFRRKPKKEVCHHLYDEMHSRRFIFKTPLFLGRWVDEYDPQNLEIKLVCRNVAASKVFFRKCLKCDYEDDHHSMFYINKIWINKTSCHVLIDPKTLEKFTVDTLRKYVKSQTVTKVK